MTRIFTDKTFIRPREALNIVGEWTHGSDWRPEYIDDDKCPLRVQAAGNLRVLLMRDSVRSDYVTSDFQQRRMQVSDFRHEFFRFDFTESGDGIFHPQVGEPTELHIHRKDLERELFGEAPKPVPTIAAKTACEEWLVERFKSDEQIPTRAILLAQCTERFQKLSVRGFDDARRAAIKKTGRQDLSAGGRRKN